MLPNWKEAVPNFAKSSKKYLLKIKNKIYVKVHRLAKNLNIKSLLSYIMSIETKSLLGYFDFPVTHLAIKRDRKNC